MSDDGGEAWEGVPLAQWSNGQVLQWISSLSIGFLIAPLFRSHVQRAQVLDEAPLDGQWLLTSSDLQLRQLGLNLSSHRSKILREIARVHGTNTLPAVVAVSPATSATVSLGRPPPPRPRPPPRSRQQLTLTTPHIPTTGLASPPIPPRPTARSTQSGPPPAHTHPTSLTAHSAPSKPGMLPFKPYTDRPLPTPKPESSPVSIVSPSTPTKRSSPEPSIPSSSLFANTGNASSPPHSLILSQPLSPQSSSVPVHSRPPRCQAPLSPSSPGFPPAATAHRHMQLRCPPSLRARHNTTVLLLPLPPKKGTLKTGVISAPDPTTHSECQGLQTVEPSQKRTCARQGAPSKPTSRTPKPPPGRMHASIGNTHPLPGPALSARDTMRTPASVHTPRPPPRKAIGTPPIGQRSFGRSLGTRWKGKRPMECVSARTFFTLRQDENIVRQNRAEPSEPSKQSASLNRFTNNLNKVRKQGALSPRSLMALQAHSLADKRRKILRSASNNT